MKRLINFKRNQANHNILCGKRNQANHNILCGKRGQFFLLAAVIISVVITGLAVTRNYVIAQEEPRDFYDLSKDIKTEGARVVDFGVYQDNVDEDELKILLGDFIVEVGENFYDVNPDNEIVFIYGNEEGFDIVNLAKRNVRINSIDDSIEVTGGIRQISNRMGWGDVNLNIPGNFRNYQENWIGSFSGENVNNYIMNGKVKITFDGNDYEFELKGNQMFYLLMRREVDDNVYLDKR